MAVFTPKIKTLPKTILVGKHMAMSHAEDRTPMLWEHFMAERKLISNASSDDLYSVSVYDRGFDSDLENSNQYFKKWAAVEVEDAENIPTGMGTVVIEGLYAAFHYKGLSTDPYIFEYIFTEWLPNTAYRLDDRPHFEILGSKYKNDDPESEEDIYIPVML